MRNASAAVESDTKAKRLRLIAALLIALAFAAPLLALPFKISTPYLVGQQIGTLCFITLVLLLIEKIATARRSALAKARFRTVIGILLCLVTSYATVNAIRDKAIGKRFLTDAIALQQRHEARFEELGQRLDKIDFAQYLTPAALVSATSIDAGQAEVARYRAMLVERETILQTNIGEANALVASLPKGPMRSAAETSAEPRIRAAAQIFKPLNASQSQYADAVVAILDWAKRNNGRMSVQDGHLVFETAEQLRELRQLSSKLQEVANVVDADATKAQAEITKLTADAEQNLRKAKALLDD